MGVRIQILAILASISIIIFVIILIRQRKLKEEYSIMWLIGSAVLIVFSFWRDLLDIIAQAVGIYYAPAILLLVGLFFGIVIFLHLTVVISKHSNQSKSLAQKIALLEEKLNRHCVDKQEGSVDE